MFDSVDRLPSALKREIVYCRNENRQRRGFSSLRMAYGFLNKELQSKMEKSASKNEAFYSGSPER